MDRWKNKAERYTSQFGHLSVLVAQQENKNNVHAERPIHLCLSPLCSRPKKVENGDANTIHQHNIDSEENWMKDRVGDNQTDARYKVWFTCRWRKGILFHDGGSSKWLVFLHSAELNPPPLFNLSCTSFKVDQRREVSTFCSWQCFPNQWGWG